MPMRVITFKIEQDMLEALDALALKYGVSRSEVIRKGIELIIKQQGQPLRKPRGRIRRIIIP